MIRNNKLKMIISSILVLLPMLFGLIFWNKLPVNMTTHWGADGTPDGSSSKAFAVFFMPLLLLALHILALIWTDRDPGNKNQSLKALGITYWICPAISLMSNGVMYSVALGYDTAPTIILPIFMGILFLFIGNYIPKCKQNRSIGIKIRSTLESEANWNATHRFAGKVWFIGGIITLLLSFLPTKIMLSAVLVVILITAFIPIVYSLIYRKKEREAGVPIVMKPYSKMQKIMSIICIAIAVAASIFALVITFTGDINVTAEAEYLNIEADYYDDLKIYYDDIETITLRHEVTFGQRSFGFGSGRLMMGIFKNEEFGSYTLYAYMGAKTAIVITSKEGDVLVIALKNAEQTERLYNALSDGGIKS